MNRLQPETSCLLVASILPKEVGVLIAVTPSCSGRKHRKPHKHGCMTALERLLSRAYSAAFAAPTACAKRDDEATADSTKNL